MHSTSVLLIPQCASLARRGLLYTIEHTHLLEPALEGQILGFHTAEYLAKSGASFTLGPLSSGFKKNGMVREVGVRQRPHWGPLELLIHLSHQSIFSLMFRPSFTERQFRGSGPQDKTLSCLSLFSFPGDPKGFYMRSCWAGWLISEALTMHVGTKSRTSRGLATMVPLLQETCS